MTRSVTLHAFASTKGGVGKSTLAVAAAAWIVRERPPRVAAIVDLDLTGSSLADGLELLAPNLELDSFGRFDISKASADGWLDEASTRQRRHQRKMQLGGTAFASIPYSNDALLAREDARIFAWLWKDRWDSKVRYLPASSLRGDIERATVDLVRVPGADWRDALICSLLDLVNGSAEVTDVVLDLPPGTWGFGHGALAALHALDSKERGGIQWSVNPLIVTSEDTNALLPTLEYVASSQHRFRAKLLPVVNRASEAPEGTRRRAARALVGPLARLGLEDLLTFLDENRTLRRLFQGGDSPEAFSGFAEALRLG